MFVNTLTMVSVLILLSGYMIRTVYIVAVWLIGAKHPMLQLKRLFFVTKKNFFLLTPSKDSRGVLLLPAHGLFFVATQKECFREHSMECSFTTGSRL